MDGARSRGGDTRRRLLDAAEAIVLRSGPDRLALDAVASAGGGGIGSAFDSFGARDVLIAAMTARRSIAEGSRSSTTRDCSLGGKS